MSLVSRLNNLIDVYDKVKTINLLREVDYSYIKIKSVWSEIIPTSGSIRNSEGNTIYADVSHKITIRSKSIPNLSDDMYFMYQGKRFDIKFFQPNYKNKDRVEIMCSLVVE